MGRNRIINGDMVIDQQNAGTSVSVANNVQPGPDMVQSFGAGGATGVFSMQQLSATPPSGFSNYTRLTVTTPDTTPGSGIQYAFNSLIEGLTIRDFALGTSAAVTFTMSFWVRASVTGTYSIGFTNSVPNRSYVSTYTVNSANTWEKKSITVVGDTTGTWIRDSSGRGIQIFWDLGSGTGHEGTTNSWQGSFIYRAAGSTKFLATNGATLDFTGLQIEIGSVATGFEFRLPEVELAMCQRYLETTYFGAAIGSASNNYYDSANAVQINTTTMRSQSMPFKVLKRVAPTVTLYTTSGVSGQWNWISTTGSNTVRNTVVTDAFPNHINIQQTTAVEYLAQGHWAADARL